MARRSLSLAFAGAVVLSIGAAAPACTDLFHGTDWEHQTNFCAWTSDVARANAQHACAWLGACAGPTGKNAFGECMVSAVLAYDCAANPNRQVLGAAHEFWDQLWQANDCDAVSRAVSPSASVVCGAASAPYSACESNVRLSCPATDAGARAIENCGAWGQTCAVAGSNASCAGSLGAACMGASAPSCDGTKLHECDPTAGAFDLGVDCADFGAGSCADAGACQAAGGASCAPTAQITCANDVATGCPSGAQETVDCARVLGAPGSCNAAATGRAWEVSRACTVGTCAADSCSGTVLTSCARGAPQTVDCAHEGFTSCAVVMLPGDSTAHAVCVR